MCILDELYHEWHSPREKPQAEDHAEWERNETLWEQAEKYLSPELLEELQRSVAVLMEQESCREFREGFRLGVGLLLETNLFPN